MLASVSKGSRRSARSGEWRYKHVGPVTFAKGLNEAETTCSDCNRSAWPPFEPVLDLLAVEHDESGRRGTESLSVLPGRVIRQQGTIPCASYFSLRGSMCIFMPLDDIARLHIGGVVTEPLRVGDRRAVRLARQRWVEVRVRFDAERIVAGGGDC
jgi:hypothetical protein